MRHLGSRPWANALLWGTTAIGLVQTAPWSIDGFQSVAFAQNATLVIPLTGGPPATAVSSTNPLPVAVISGGGGGAAIATPSNSFVRPANASAYASGTLVANSTTAGSVVDLSWSAPTSTFRIVRARLSLSSKSVTNTNFRIHFFNSSTGVALGDGTTFVPSVLANEVCEMDVTVALAGSDVSQGYGASNQGIACYVALASGTAFYGLIEARAAYTPASGETITVIPELN